FDAGDLLGGVDRVALDHEADACCDQQLLRGKGGVREGEKRVHRVPVVLGQLGAAGPRRKAAGRDVRMLGDPQRFEPELLDGRGELGHGDRIVGRKDGDAELHASIVTGPGTTPSPFQARRLTLPVGFKDELDFLRDEPGNIDCRSRACMSAATTCTSRWLPASSWTTRRASLAPHACRYGRSVVSTS